MRKILPLLLVVGLIFPNVSAATFQPTPETQGVIVVLASESYALNASEVAGMRGLPLVITQDKVFSEDVAILILAMKPNEVWVYGEVPRQYYDFLEEFGINAIKMTEGAFEVPEDIDAENQKVFEHTVRVSKGRISKVFHTLAILRGYGIPAPHAFLDFVKFFRLHDPRALWSAEAKLDAYAPVIAAHFVPAPQTAP